MKKEMKSSPMLPMELRTLTLEELRKAYDKDLRAAFPVNELRPLEVLERLCEDGVYEPLALFEKGEPIGYAFLWKDADGYMLFDYLAVTESRRGSGLGTKILHAVLRHCAAAPAVFGEVEAPLGADTAQDAAICRRLAFYERNGIVKQGYDCALFGVYYHVMGSVRPEVSREELMAHHIAFYKNHLSAERFARFIQIPVFPGDKIKPFEEETEADS